jgi:lipopolysaccharide biosynthesis glycosyltransferase
VSLKSLLDHNKVTKVYVLYSNLSEKLKRKAIGFVKKRCLIEFIPVISDQFSDLEKHYFGVEAYFRLLLPQLIKDDKAWYIDVDTLITGSIESPFYDDLQMILAAVPKLNQENFVNHKIKLGMKESANYFNSGVLLLNLKEIRKTGFFEQTIKWITLNIKKIDMPDQDALNAKLNGNYHELEAAYNVTTEMAKNFKNPKIIHFTGIFKPNLFFYRPAFKREFMRYTYYNLNSFKLKSNIQALVLSLKLRFYNFSKLRYLYKKFKNHK